VECDADVVVAPLVDVVGAAVPNVDVARSVLPFRDRALEVAEIELVIFDLDCEMADTRSVRQPFRDRPRLEHAILFQPEIKMVRSCMVLLHHESAVCL